MKKIIILAIAALIALPSATMAQSIYYQGELSVGFATGGKLTVKEDGVTAKLKTDFSRPFVETVHGVRITEYAFVGVGVGVQYAYGQFLPEESVNEKWGTLLTPLFVNMKGYYPVSEDFAPYITVNFGASPVLFSNLDESEDGYKENLVGGFYYKLGAGFSYKRFLFDFGLMHQALSAKSSYQGYSEKIGLGGINSFYVNLGVKF